MKLLPARIGGPVVSLLILIYSAGKPTKIRSIRTNTVTVPNGPTLLRVDLMNRANRTDDRSSVQSGGWRYEKKVDKTGRTVYKASVTSANAVPFAYPYQGGSSATLTIRTGNDGPYVSIEVANGQFNRSFQAGTAHVRFDGKPPVTYALSAAANGRANIVFFDAAPRLINHIRAALNTMVQVRFEGQPARQIQFRTAGLRWNHG